MVGASPNWNRPSYFVMRYLQRKGYRVIPVNPRALDAPILGETVYPDLDVDPRAGRRRGRLPPAGGGARRSPTRPSRIGAKVLWLQLGIRNAEARGDRRAAGLTVIQDRCMKIEYGRLSRRARLERHQHAASSRAAARGPLG